MNRILRVTIGFLHLVRVRLVAVIEHTVIINVRKRVEVRMRDAMECHADPVGAKPEHLMLIGLRIVDCLFGIHIRRQRYGETFFHQRRSLFPFRGRDEVHRTDLVVLAPAAPIVEILLPLLKLLRRDFAVSRDSALRCARTQGEH